MNVAFFHGLESLHISDKSDFLYDNFNHAYCPKMDYFDVNIYRKQLEYIKLHHFDLLIGSSMGGWFAYCLSLDTGIDTILFNPAFDRMYFTDIIANRQVKHNIVLGKYDDIVDPDVSKEYIRDHGYGKFEIHEENIHHRIPIEVFKKYMKIYI